MGWFEDGDRRGLLLKGEMLDWVVGYGRRRILHSFHTGGD